MPSPELVAIIGSVIGVGLALAVLILRSTTRIDADRRAFQSEAAQDRRAMQSAMDTFRTEMQAPGRTPVQSRRHRRSRLTLPLPPYAAASSAHHGSGWWD